MQGNQKLAGPGKDLDSLLADQFAIELFLAVPEPLDLRGIRAPAIKVRDDFLVLFSESRLEMAGWQGFLDFRRKQLPRPFVLRRGINHDPVPVKNHALHRPRTFRTIGSSGDGPTKASVMREGSRISAAAIEGVRPCLLTFMAFSADLLPCQESRWWNMLGLFTK